MSWRLPSSLCRIRRFDYLPNISDYYLLSLIFVYHAIIFMLLCTVLYMSRVYHVSEWGQLKQVVKNDKVLGLGTYMSLPHLPFELYFIGI